MARQERASDHIAAGSSAAQKQHVQFFRKVLMRKRLLRWAEPGAAYVPFIGDGDLAAALYADRRIYGADLNPARVATAEARLSKAVVIEADCDGWPFRGLEEALAIADFDAYNDPYIGFREFWPEAKKKDRMVLFFTDGRLMGMERTGHWVKPDGSRLYLPIGPARQKGYNFYYSKHVLPWFKGYIAGQGYRVLEAYRYRRMHLLYWGVAIQRTAPLETGIELGLAA